MNDFMDCMTGDREWHEANKQAKAVRHYGEVCEALSLLNEEDIDAAVLVLKGVKARGGHVWIVGNGGSAATAAHFANDLLKMCHVKAVDVSAMTPVTLAYGNDLGWDRMFVNTIKELANPMDVIVLISCSGKSPNIVNIPPDLSFRCDIIAMTGPDENLLWAYRKQSVVAVLIRAVAEDITVQEDIHSIVCHAIARKMRA